MPNNRIERHAQLWARTDELRGNSNLRGPEFVMPILALIFLRYVESDTSNKKHRISQPAWSKKFSNLLSLGKREHVGSEINKVMAWLEEMNQDLEGVLPQTFTSIDNSILASLLGIIARVDTDSEDVSFGSLYEFLLGKFASDAGRWGSDFCTPKEVAELLALLLNPRSGMSVYDPCFGTATVLREAFRYVTRTTEEKGQLFLYGQEINQELLSIGKMNLIVNGAYNTDLRLGNTLKDPSHVTQDGLTKFDRVVSTPPFGASLRGVNLEDDEHARFRYGIPPVGSADFAFVQHMIATLKPDGVMAIVVPHGVLYRGNREGRIRQAILEDDLIEAVIGLPPALFYGTGISAAILVINKNKVFDRIGKVLFINADRGFEREGHQNFLRPEDVSRITKAFADFRNEERYSKVVCLDEIKANSFNLNIPRYADSSPLAGLVTQYDTFEKHTIKELAVEINSAPQGGEFGDKPNAVYISITGKQSAYRLESLDAKHGRFYQVVLKENAINSYVAQFLGTSVGQHALSILTVGNVVQRLSKSDLAECIIALPSLDHQKEIVLTHQKLSALKVVIGKFDSELSLNPTGLSEFQKQVDAMLTVIGELSEADYLRNIIRNGESKTVEFKETFSLDVRKQTKEKYIEDSSLKTIVAFLNTDGGVLLVGVSDDEKIIGIDIELGKFHGDNRDKFLLHFKNSVSKRIGEEYYPFIDYRIAEAEGHKVLVVDCKQSKSPCFLDKNNFYVRTNPATDKLEGPTFLEYVKHHFGP